jgi:tetratricopeptide (TPR) repeat protein
MKLSSHMGKRGTWIWLCFLLLAVIPSGTLVAQDRSPTFEDMAAQAAAARDENDIPKAVELYTQALKLNPEWQDGWWSLGFLQYGSASYASAIDAFSRLLVLNSQFAPALALRGLCEFQTADYQQSLADISKGLALGAADDAQKEQILHYHQAMLFTRLGNFQDALKAYAVFAEHKLSNPELLVAIGLAGLRMPLLPDDVKPEEQELLSAVGGATFKFMAGDQAAAEQAFNDVFQRFPSAQNVHFLYGNLLSAFGPDAAVPQFKKELEVAPGNSNALTMLAWSLLMENRADEALPYAKRVAEKDPKPFASQLVLGRALLDTGDVAGGLQHLGEALKLQPDNIEIHLALAKAYSKSGRDDDARRERALCLQMTQNGVAPLAHP